MTLTLFDIPYSVAPNTSWSPNTLRTVIALNLKGIPHGVQWVEYPDIAGVLKGHNIGPTGKKQDGTDYYTLPAILDVDDSTGKVKAAIADSVDIAKYLDQAYPDKGTKLFPGDAVTVKIVDDFSKGLIGPQNFPFLVLLCRATLPKLNEASRAHFSRNRAENFYAVYKTTTLEDIQLSQEEELELWAQAKDGFDKLDEKLKESDAEGPWYLGKTISFADVVIGALVAWVKRIYGEESEEWKEVSGWNEGRWGKYLKDLEEAGGRF